MPIQRPNDVIFDSSKMFMPSEAIAQSYDYDCAVRSQEIVLRDFGIIVSEDDLCREASANGWYNPQVGTPIECVGNLLEAHGVEVNHFTCSNQFHLANELAQGHRVIVAVDANELHEPGILHDLSELLDGPNANHALIVSGLDYSNPLCPQVVVTDPGTGEAFRSYPMDKFLDAWADSNFQMVSTIDPAPGIENFDYAQGHIDAIGGLYGTWDDLVAELAGMGLDVDFSHDIGSDMFMQDSDIDAVISLTENDMTDSGITYGNE